MKKQKSAVDLGKLNLKMVNKVTRNNSKSINDSIGGIRIDKSLYTQETNYRPGGFTSRSHSNDTGRRVDSAGQKKTVAQRPIEEKKLLSYLLPL